MPVFQIRTLARLATAIENQSPEALSELDQLPPGHAPIVGITGPPGAGKSTLVDALARTLRAQNQTVAIIAIDPTSRATGGAILGDRIRMQQHHADPGIFIRSMATRGAIGGIARTTANLARLFRSAGFDFVIIETVGVGQDEIEIAALADVTVVVLVPGMGDEVQAIKSGIMEIADIFAINKADYPGVERTEREIHANARSSPIVRTIATEGVGIEELLSAIRNCPPKTQTPPPEFSIDHLGIAVNSLETAIHFYEQLGLSVSAREQVPYEKVNVAMLPAGGPRIELLQASDPESAIAKFIAKRGPGLHHLALRVPRLAPVIEKLRVSGAKLLSEPQRGAGGHLYVFVHPSSTGGVLLELIQDQ